MVHKIETLFNESIAVAIWVCFYRIRAAGIVWAFKQGDCVAEISRITKKTVWFIEEVIRQELK